MDFALTEDQQAIVALARRILTEKAPPEALGAWEADGAIAAPAWQALAEAGLVGVAVDEAHGGAGMGFFELCLLLEEVGRSAAPVPLLASMALGAGAIATAGSAAQQQAWLPKAAAGEIVLTPALETSGAPDGSAATVAASARGSGWSLSGVRDAVPFGMQAERVVVPAQTDDGAIVICLVDPSAPGARREPQRLTDRQPACRLTLESATVEPSDVLTGSGAEALAALHQRGRVAWCALQLGMARRAVEMTAAYAGERKQFGRPIGTFQAVAQRVADAFIDVQVMQATVRQAAWRLDRGLDAAAAVDVARYHACAAGSRAVFAAQHIHAGAGFDTDYPLFRYFVGMRRAALELGGGEAALARLGAGMAAQ